MNLESLIKRHEGNGLPGKPFEAYRCPSGFWTIGYGHNIEANGLRITEAQADELLREDLQRATNAAIRIVGSFRMLNPPRQAVIISMIYQMGAEGFSKFVKTIVAIESEDFNLASERMLKSVWASQTPTRAKELAHMMREGKWIE